MKVKWLRINLRVCVHQHFVIAHFLNISWWSLDFVVYSPLSRSSSSQTNLVPVYAYMLGATLWTLLDCCARALDGPEIKKVAWGPASAAAAATRVVDFSFGLSIHDQMEIPLNDIRIVSPPSLSLKLNYPRILRENSIYYIVFLRNI